MKRLIWALSLAAMAVAFTIACGNDRRAPTAPSGIAPPAASPSSLVCPADVEPTSPDGQPVAVTFAPPTLDTAGGSITAVCSPPSGSIFEVGTHTVTCVRSDGADAQCSFSIAVVVPELPQTILSVSTVLAFGDSLTEGEVSPAPSMLMAVQPGNDYPARLEALLRGRFPNQMVSVANRGLGGETASEGEDRFLGTFLDTEPDLVLLLEGVNDLARGLLVARMNGQELSRGIINGILDDLRRMARAAQVRGAQVFILTLSPILDPAERRNPGLRNAVALVNQRLETMTASIGAVLVDLHSLLSAEPSLIGIDGLHPTAAGYERIATFLFDEIVRRFETTPMDLVAQNYGVAARQPTRAAFDGPAALAGRDSSP